MRTGLAAATSAAAVDTGVLVDAAGDDGSTGGGLGGGVRRRLASGSTVTKADAPALPVDEAAIGGSAAAAADGSVSGMSSSAAVPVAGAAALMPSQQRTEPPSSSQPAAVADAESPQPPIAPPAAAGPPRIPSVLFMVHFLATSPRMRLMMPLMLVTGLGMGVYNGACVATDCACCLNACAASCYACACVRRLSCAAAMLPPLTLPCASVVAHTCRPVDGQPRRVRPGRCVRRLRRRCLQLHVGTGDGDVGPPRAAPVVRPPVGFRVRHRLPGDVSGRVDVVEPRLHRCASRRGSGRGCCGGCRRCRCCGDRSRRCCRAAASHWRWRAQQGPRRPRACAAGHLVRSGCVSQTLRRPRAVSARFSFVLSLVVCTATLALPSATAGDSVLFTFTPATLQTFFPSGPQAPCAMAAIRFFNASGFSASAILSVTLASAGAAKNALSGGGGAGGGRTSLQFGLQLGCLLLAAGALWYMHTRVCSIDLMPATAAGAAADGKNGEMSTKDAASDWDGADSTSSAGSPVAVVVPAARQPASQAPAAINTATAPAAQAPLPPSADDGSEW